MRVILTQEAYAGTTYAYKYKSVGKNEKVLRPKEEWIPIPVPVIVDRAMWEYAQQRLRERDFERKKQEDHTKKYLMSRRCKCGLCNSSMHGIFRRTNNTRLYYVCNSPNTASGQCSKNIYYRAEAVDSIVWSFVQDLMNNPTALLEGYKQAQQHTNSQYERTLQELELVNAEIADYSEQLSSILDQRAKAKVKLLIDTLDQRAENVAIALERLEDKRIKLIEKSTDAVITDEQIAAIAEFVADVKDG